MVQVLPYVQTPLEQLTPYLANASQMVGTGLTNYFNRKADSSSANVILNPNSTPIDKITAYGNMSQEGRAKFFPVMSEIYKHGVERQEAEAANRALAPQQMETAAQPQGEGQQAEQPVKKYGNFSYTQSELPKVEQPVLAVGGAKEVGREQYSRFAENRKATKEYMEDVGDVRRMEEQLQRLEDSHNDLRAGKIGATKLKRFTQAFLEDKDKSEIAKIFQTPEEQKLFSTIRPLLDVKEIGGSNPSTKEVMLALQSNPSILNSPAANEYIFQALENSLKTRLETARAGRDILQEQPNMPLPALQKMLDVGAAKLKETLPKAEVKAPSDKFSKLPNAANYEGKTIRDKQTGKRYKATAGKWTEIK